MLDKLLAELRQIAADHKSAGLRAHSLQANWDTLLQSDQLNELASRHDHEGHINTSITDTSTNAQQVMTVLMESINSAKDSIDFLNENIAGLDNFLETKYRERNNNNNDEHMMRHRPSPTDVASHHHHHNGSGAPSSSSSPQQARPHHPAPMPTWNVGSSNTSRSTPQPSTHYIESNPTAIGDLAVTSPEAPPPDVKRPTIVRLLAHAAPSTTINQHDEDPTRDADGGGGRASKPNMITTLKLALTAKGEANVQCTPNVIPNADFNIVQGTSIARAFSDIVISNNAEITPTTSVGAQSFLCATLPARNIMVRVHDERCIPTTKATTAVNGGFDPRMVSPSFQQHQGRGGGSVSPGGMGPGSYHHSPMMGYGSSVAPQTFWSSPHPHMSPRHNNNPFVESSGMGFTTVGIVGLASVLIKDAATSARDDDTNKTAHKGLYVVRPGKKEEASALVERLRKVVDSELNIINLIDNIIPRNMSATAPRLIVATTEHVEDGMVEPEPLTRLVWDGFRQTYNPLIVEFINLVGITLRGPSDDLSTVPTSSWNLLFAVDIVCHKKRDVVVVFVNNVNPEVMKEGLLSLPQASPPPPPSVQQPHMSHHNTSTTSSYPGGGGGALLGGSSPSYRQPPPLQNHQYEYQYGSEYPPIMSSVSQQRREGGEEPRPRQRPLLNIIVTSLPLTSTQRDDNKKTARDRYNNNKDGRSDSFYASSLDCIEDDIGRYLEDGMGMIDNIAFEWHKKLDTDIVAAKTIARCVSVFVYAFHYDEASVAEDIGNVIGVRTVSISDLRGGGGRTGTFSPVGSGRSLPRVRY